MTKFETGSTKKRKRVSVVGNSRVGLWSSTLRETAATTDLDRGNKFSGFFSRYYDDVNARAELHQATTSRKENLQGYLT